LGKGAVPQSRELQSEIYHFSWLQAALFLKRFTQHWSWVGIATTRLHIILSDSDSLDVSMLVLFFRLGPLANVCEQRLIDSTWLHLECPGW